MASGWYPAMRQASAGKLPFNGTAIRWVPLAHDVEVRSIERGQRRRVVARSCVRELKGWRRHLGMARQRL
jgi:hypothetical protein